MAKSFDAIVVGAGPAGSSAASALTSSGCSVLLLEKERLTERGRYKACGGAVEWDLLEAVKCPPGLISRRVSCLELHHASGEIFRKLGVGGVLWRGLLDKHLNDQAVSLGAVLHDGEALRQIRKVSSNPLLYEVVTEKSVYRAPYVIASDGVASPTLRALGWPRIAKQDLVATVTWEVRIPGEQIEYRLGKEVIHLFFGIRDVSPMGYAWLFPKEDLVTVGWGCRIVSLSKARGGFRAFIRRPEVAAALQGGELLLEKRHLVPIGVRARIVHEQVLGAGDAVGFVDPLSGKGIPYAILSGQMAGELVAKAVQEKDSGGLVEAYTEGLRERFLKNFEMKRTLLPEIYSSDSCLKTYLRLWQQHRSTEIVENGLFGKCRCPGLPAG